MSSPWVNRALANDLPAKALDRTPTRQEHDEVVKVTSGRWSDVCGDCWYDQPALAGDYFPESDRMATCSVCEYDAFVVAVLPASLA